MLLGTEVLRGTGLQWDVSVNWSRNRSKVLALHESVESIVLGSYTLTYEARVGEAYGVPYGDIFRRDATGNVVVNSSGFPLRDANQKLADTSEPSWIGGIRNDFRFGLMQLSFLVDVRRGGFLWCGTCRLMLRDGIGIQTVLGREGGITVNDNLEFSDPVSGVNGVRMEGVQEDGSVNTVYANPKDFWNQYSRVEETLLYETNWAKLRELKLSFDLTPNILENLPFSTGRVTLVGRNLLLFTDIPHIDPESDGNSGIDNHGRGLEYLSQPSDRTFGINISVTR